MRRGAWYRGSPRWAGTILLAGLLAACGGGSSSDGGGGFTPPPSNPTPPPPPPPPPPPASGPVTLSGKVEYRQPTATGVGLDFNTLETRPSRGVTVEVIRSSDGQVIGSAVTDAAGNYSVQVDAATLFVRAKAQLRSSGGGPGYDFEIRDNTSGNALYALDSSEVTPAGNTTVNLIADVALPGEALGTGDRPAGPFAILDMLWRAKELIQTVETVSLPAIDIYWSIDNVGSQPTGECAGQPNPVTGEIGTSFFLNGTIPASGSCPAVPAGIYVLGEFASDADEFDPSVIAHEFGHYYEDELSRSESMGGPHALSSRSDFRLAYSEGWGNAFSGMVLDNPVYRDTFDRGRLSFDFNMDTDRLFNGVEGWFSEASVGELLWDVYDGANDDPVSLGFGPIHQMMRGPARASDALSSIYVAFAGLTSANGAQAAALGQLLDGEGIAGRGDFAAGETNNIGADPTDVNLLPLYVTLTPGVATSVTSTDAFRGTSSFDSDYVSYNRAGARRYLVADVGVATAGFQVRVAGPVGSDPDFQLFRRGQVVCRGFADSRATGVEIQSCPLAGPGRYVLEVYECSNLGLQCSDEQPLGDTNLSVTVTPQ